MTEPPARRADENAPRTERLEPRTLFSVAQIQHVLRIEFGRAQRHRYPLVCLLISIDQLGPLRDRHGYEAKEGIFETVVGLLSDVTRSSDFLGRMADDRIMAVIPHTTKDGATRLAERLTAKARAMQLEPPLPRETITLSCGSSTSERGEVLYYDALLAAAESALGEAQAQGGDRHIERDAL
jgi:two-component system, cell cycle response regulator